MSIRRINSRSSAKSCCHWLNDCGAVTCTLERTQIGFFIICRLGVCRVVRRPLRSSRGLRLRRLLGSRILLSTSYSVFANCVNSSSPIRASSTSKTAQSATPASRLKSCISKTALSFKVFVSCFAIAAWSLFCAFMSIVFVCLTESKIRNLFRYASFFVKNFDFFLGHKKSPHVWRLFKSSLCNKLGNNPSG